MECLDMTQLLFKPKEQPKQIKKPKKELHHMNVDKVTVPIKLLRPSSKMPTLGTKGAAAYDLYADIPDKIVMQPLSTVLVSTGIAVKIPEGCCGLILPRSGLSLKSPLRISNAPGLIDSDYIGEIKIIVDNIGQGFATIEPGMKLAQLLIQSYPEVRFQETDDLGQTERGEKGFGSTGNK